MRTKTTVALLLIFVSLVSAGVLIRRSAAIAVIESDPIVVPGDILPRQAICSWQASYSQELYCSMGEYWMTASGSRVITVSRYIGDHSIQLYNYILAWGDPIWFNDYGSGIWIGFTGDRKVWTEWDYLTPNAPVRILGYGASQISRRSWKGFWSQERREHP